MSFVDEVKIFVAGGKGGSGCVSFRREKFIEFGGPDGGNGGDGGDLILEAVPSINTLLEYRHLQRFIAQAGNPGGKRRKTGARGADMILRVPVGTQVFIAQDQEIPQLRVDTKQTSSNILLYDRLEDFDGNLNEIQNYEEIGNEQFDIENDEKQKKEEKMIADLDTPYQRFTVMHGGRGGAGNAVFKNSVNQAPRRFLPGAEGESSYVVLKLKLISDVGLIGAPNAGKSTFLSLATAATPKIASYPFTTLHPKLGVAHAEDFSFVIADLPGLIEGAHLGAGLGQRFLKHIERCKVFLHLIDISADDFIEKYDMICRELACYDIKLLERPMIIGLTKCDLLPYDERLMRKDLLAEHCAQQGVVRDVLLIQDRDSNCMQQPEHERPSNAPSIGDNWPSVHEVFNAALEKSDNRALPDNTNASVQAIVVRLAEILKQEMSSS